tara:strand:- start:15 stop:977 length:963 start_codon:yes stop_codon:yes gene_type:complete
MFKNLIIFSLFILLPSLLLAQKIDNTAAFRAINSDRYFRFHYDNDYFSATDENYTQGYNLELVDPILSKNPINFLFLNPKTSQTQFGISIEHIGFTPPRIGSREIQYGERPFAAAIMLKNFSISTDTLGRTRLLSSLSLGIIGPGAFGKEMQVAIHKATGNTIPLGWRNQIKNDVVINYELGYEKELYRLQDWFALQSNSAIRLGTLSTNASVGLQTTLGLINSPFTASDVNKKFKLYGYSQVTGSVIGYDASLQGGIFNKTSPYTIADNEIERFTGQFNYGLILQLKSVYLEYFRAVLTREFEAGDATKWGGIRIGIQL